ncbi:MAG: GIY-YIG nuclease family protein [Armatimonadota bacterium]
MADTVYLLHFERPYKHAQHYIGYTSDLESRLTQHRNGTGARLIQVINAAGIKFKLARTWSGDRNFERKLKNYKHSSKLCPICRTKTADHGGRENGLQSNKTPAIASSDGTMGSVINGRSR